MMRTLRNFHYARVCPAVRRLLEETVLVPPVCRGCWIVGCGLRLVRCPRPAGDAGAAYSSACPNIFFLMQSHASRFGLSGCMHIVSAKHLLV